MKNLFLILCFSLFVGCDKNEDNGIGNDRILFEDAKVVKKFLQDNGHDVSDERWDTNDPITMIALLQENGTLANGDDFNNLSSFRVTEMYYHDSNISIIPLEFSQLKGLERLLLRNNNISNIPNILDDLEQLRYLDLGFNNISELPRSFWVMRSLEEILLDHNELNSLPDSDLLPELHKIERIWLGHNNFTEAPIKLSEISPLNLSPTIKFIEFEANNLMSVSGEYGKLFSLETLRFDDNPNLLCLPSAVWNLGANGTEIFYDGQTNDVDCTN